MLYHQSDTNNMIYRGGSHPPQLAWNLSCSHCLTPYLNDLLMHVSSFPSLSIIL
jgi:hypothetical protein